MRRLIARIAVEGLLTRMLPLLSVSHRACPLDALSFSFSYMAGNCQNVCFWNFVHDCHMDRGTSFLWSVYLSQIS
jgi:hypothetical protein